MHKLHSPQLYCKYVSIAKNPNAHRQSCDSQQQALSQPAETRLPFLLLLKNPYTQINTIQI